MGSLSVLNVGIGDIKVTFNQHDSAERDKAIRMLTDMQKRGYAILICLEDGSYVRAIEIDAKLGQYIIQVPEGSPEPDTTGYDPTDVAPPVKKKKNLDSRRRVPIESAHAVGVARSAGG